MTKLNQTTAIHGGEGTLPQAKPVTQAIYTSATYKFDSTDELKAYLRGDLESFHYARYANPTTRSAELKLAALEGADEAILVSSGMAALSTTFLSLLKTGQHVIFTSDVYRPTAELLAGFLGKFGVESDRVDINDIEAVEAAIRPGETKVIFTELTTNPHTRVVDFERLVAIKKKARARLVVDATFATPYNARPLALGADIVVHSVTKYLGGHNDVVAGVIASRAGIADAIRDQRALLGCSLDANSSYQIIRGLKTFVLRMERHNENALHVAKWLEAHPRVTRVFYPFLESHPDYERATTILRGGGGVVSFLFDGDKDATSTVIDNLDMIAHSASLGGVESLAHQPCVFSYSDMSAEARQEIGIFDNLIRLSVGLEQVEDILADLERALAAP